MDFGAHSYLKNLELRNVREVPEQEIREEREVKSTSGPRIILCNVIGCIQFFNDYFR